MSDIKVPIYESDVHKQLDFVSSYLFATNEANLSLRLSELQTLQKILLDQEKELYKIFDVGSIGELNERVQKCTGLINLGGAKLSSSLHSKLLDDSTNSMDTLLYNIVHSSDFQKTIQKYMINQVNTLKLDKVIISELISSLAEKGKEYTFKSNENIGLGKLLKDATYDTIQQKIKLATKKDEVSSDFLRRAKNIFNKIQIDDKGQQAIMTLETPTEQNRKVYAGWRLQRKLSKEEEENVRNKILKFCIELMKGPSSEEVAAFKQVYNTVPTSSLIVYDISGLQGLIGELAAAAMLNILTNGKQIKNPIITGKLFTAGTKVQTAIDIILSNYGFQIKNYNEFSLGEGLEKTISLNRTNSLKLWEDKFELSDSLSWVLDVFYGVKGFNVAATDEYTGEAHIEAVNKNLKNFYLQFPDKILRMYDDIEGLDLADPKSYKHFYNVFWFVSGQKFIPSSLIIQNIIDYFSHLNSKSLLRGMDLTTSSTYSKTNYKELYQAQRIEDYETYFLNKSPSITEVANATSVTIKWQMHLDNIFSSISASII